MTATNMCSNFSSKWCSPPYELSGEYPMAIVILGIPSLGHCAPEGGYTYPLSCCWVECGSAETTPISHPSLSLL